MIASSRVPTSKSPPLRIGNSMAFRFGIRRRWLRISVRTLLLIVLVISVFLGYVSNRARKQAELVRRLTVENRAVIGFMQGKHMVGAVIPQSAVAAPHGCEGWRAITRFCGSTASIRLRSARTISASLLTIRPSKVCNWTRECATRECNMSAACQISKNWKPNRPISPTNRSLISRDSASSSFSLGQCPDNGRRAKATGEVDKPQGVESTEYPSHGRWRRVAATTIAERQDLSDCLCLRAEEREAVERLITSGRDS